VNEFKVSFDKLLTAVCGIDLEPGITWDTWVEEMAVQLLTKRKVVNHGGRSKRRGSQFIKS